MLGPAHRGYLYQDLLCAASLIDVLVGNATEVIADQKMVEDDRFDDITIRWASGSDERVQVKHRDDDGDPLAMSAFTSDARDCRLDRLAATAVAYRDGPGSSAGGHVFRLLLRDAPPIDDQLTRVLRPTAGEVEPFMRGWTSRLFRLRAELLWPEPGSGSDAPSSARDAPSGADSRWRFLQSSGLSRSEFAWFCEHFVIETASPAASLDLTKPGPLEGLVLDRIAEEVGAGSYPNEGRQPVDVAAALTGAAVAGRAGRAGTLTSTEILRRTGLRHDWGAVSRAYPVDSQVEVSRMEVADAVIADADAAASSAVPLLLVGPPGQGKSWFCQRLVTSLAERDWLVAEHYFLRGGGRPRSQPPQPSCCR